MGQRWIRGPLASNAGVGSSVNDYVRTCKDFNLFVYYFLRHIMGYTLVDSGVQAGSTWTWEGHEHTATDGVLTNTDFSFVSAAALFEAGDVGKFMVLVDNTNEENCGIYEVDSYTSAGEIALKWYTGGTAFPTASSGITWFLIDGDTAGDPRVDDFYVLEVPHATSPYTINCLYKGNGTYKGSGTLYEIVPEVNAWDSGTHAWKTTVRARLTDRKLHRGYVSDAHGRTYAYGDTDGSFWMLWDHHIGATGARGGGGVCILDPIESSPAPDPRELVYAWGSSYKHGAEDQWTRTVSSSYAMAWGTVWSELGGLAEDGWWMGWYGKSLSDIFRQNVAANARTGKRDALPIWIVRDPYNATEHFAPWGQIPPAHMVVASVNILGEDTTFESDTYLHIVDGVVIPWPSVPFG